MPVKDVNSNLSINLDVATRASIITAACRQLYNQKQTAQIGAWRQRAADWDIMELIGRTRDLGVKFYQGNEPYTLPHVITHK
jgi:hypothetical protein